MAAAALPVSLPQCPGCAGGGDVNGLVCRECGGRGRTGARRSGRGLRVLAGKLAGPAGTAVGRVLNWSRTVPGVGGAAAVTYGAAEIVHGLVSQVPVWGVAALVAGVFGLMADRRL